MEKHNSYWITGGPWYNTLVFKKLHGTVFEEFIINARTDRYNLMCFIYAHEKKNLSEHDYGNSGGAYPTPSNSTTESFFHSVRPSISLVFGCKP